MELTYPDGGRYIGEILNESLVRHGRGIFWYPKDDVYMGGWKNDVFDGEGVYIFGSGERFEGQLRNGLKNGPGTYYYASGAYYSGSWADDLKDGTGFYEDPNKQEKY